MLVCHCSHRCWRSLDTLLPLGSPMATVKERDVKRREFMGLLGGTVLGWPLVAHAQQTAMPVIGVLSGASSDTMRELMAAFHRGLADAGFASGRNVAIEYRWAEGSNDRLPALALDCAAIPTPTRTIRDDGSRTAGALGLTRSEATGSPRGGRYRSSG
jgi:hypothetical protein